MLRKLSIATKIFFIALLMLVFMIVVSAVSSYKINQVADEFHEISQFLVPISASIVEIDTHALEQQLHLERVLKFLEVEPRPEERIDEEIEQFERFDGIVREELIAVQMVVADALEHTNNERDKLEFARLIPILDILQEDHLRIHERGLRVIEATRSGTHERTELLTSLLEEDEDVFDRRIIALLEEVEHFTEEAALIAEQHERSLLIINWATSAVAVVFGIIISLFITSTLVRPLKRLLQAVKQVEDGNLDAQFIVKNRDEIGKMTEAFNIMVRGIKHKEQIKATFGQYVDPRIVSNLISNYGNELERPNRNAMTVFFSDLEGFTKISERFTPDAIVKLINEYLTLVSEPIVKRQGVIDGFLGDAVVAFWGPPFAAPDQHAQSACISALEQQQKIDFFQQMLPNILGIRQDLPRIRARMGVATGELVAGVIGSRNLKSHTVVGRCVQIAEELEGLNKVYGTSILILDSTRKEVGDAVEARMIDRVLLKGDVNFRTIYELQAVKYGLAPEKLEFSRMFEAALEEYIQGNWGVAQQKFDQCCAIDDSDMPSRVFSKRVRVLSSANNRKVLGISDWNGVWKQEWERYKIK